jgi:N-acetylglucosamine malate deacetylase 1
MIMNVVRRWITRQVSRKVRPFVKTYGLLQTVKYKPAIVWDPQGKRIVVLSPHMDDEVIGCGGTLYKHIQNGAEITVVYMTDGRYGSKDLQNYNGQERKRREKELMQVRKTEARLAIESLGIKEGIFLDAEETRLNSTNEMRSKLSRILHSIEPDLVYLPFFLEEHPDHRATSQILLDATDDSHFTFDCCAYEVWTPLFPNCFVAISDVIEKKKQALRCYQSQLAEKDFVHTSLGLNAFRSIALLDRNIAFAEAFFLSSLCKYRELYYSEQINKSAEDR